MQQSKIRYHCDFKLILHIKTVIKWPANKWLTKQCPASHSMARLSSLKQMVLQTWHRGHQWNAWTAWTEKGAPHYISLHGFIASDTKLPEHWQALKSRRRSRMNIVNTNNINVCSSDGTRTRLCLSVQHGSGSMVTQSCIKAQGRGQMLLTENT